MNKMKRLNRKIKTEEYIEKYLYNFGQGRDLKVVGNLDRNGYI